MKTLKLFLLAAASILSATFSALSLIVMLCYYGTVSALPWAFLTFFFLVGSFIANIKFDSLRT